jgi:hypothetical protein
MPFYQPVHYIIRIAIVLLWLGVIFGEFGLIIFAFPLTIAELYAIRLSSNARYPGQ